MLNFAPVFVGGMAMTLLLEVLALDAFLAPIRDLLDAVFGGLSTFTSVLTFAHMM